MNPDTYKISNVYRCVGTYPANRVHVKIARFVSSHRFGIVRKASIASDRFVIMYCGCASSCRKCAAVHHNHAVQINKSHPQLRTIDVHYDIVGGHIG